MGHQQWQGGLRLNGTGVEGRRTGGTCESKYIHLTLAFYLVWGLQNCAEDTGFLQIKTYISVGQKWDS